MSKHNEITFKDHNNNLLTGLIIDTILVPSEENTFSITNYLVKIKESGVIVRIAPYQIKQYN